MDGYASTRILRQLLYRECELPSTSHVRTSAPCAVRRARDDSTEPSANPSAEAMRRSPRKEPVTSDWETSALMEAGQEEQAPHEHQGQTHGTQGFRPREENGHVWRLKESVPPKSLAVPISRPFLYPLAPTPDETTHIEEYAGPHHEVHHRKPDIHGSHTTARSRAGPPSDRRARPPPGRTARPDHRRGDHQGGQDRLPALSHTPKARPPSYKRQCPQPLPTTADPSGRSPS